MMSPRLKAKHTTDFIDHVNQTVSIFLISALGLFLEMMLIRWIGTEVRIFAYLQNTILVVCFLGLGLGCFTSHQPIALRAMLSNLCMLVLLLAIPVTREALGKTSELLSVLSDFLIWSPVFSEEILRTLFFVFLGLGMTFFIMIIILDIFVPVGRLLGRLMNNHPNTIWAYSVNVSGSLLGTWLFVLLSFFCQPPFTWLVVFGLLILHFIIKNRSDFKINLVLLVITVILSWFAGQVAGALKVFWSPYQKLVLIEANQQKMPAGKYVVTVNNTNYQSMIDLSESHTKTNPQQYPPDMLGLSQYDIPFLIHANPQSVLLVGTGTGNDVAGALRQGVKEVTAVEIDPAIISLGRRYHPEKPYTSEAVKVINDDARSFFATCNTKFDVISFGLLDSHTTTAMTNARLDHYVYTRESIERAKSLLAKNGVMVINFLARRRYIADRMARVLRDVFDQEPIAFRIPETNYGWGGFLFIAGDLDNVKKQIIKNQRLSNLIERLNRAYPLSFTYTTKIASDDWPYIYLKSPQIPLLFYLLAGLMILLFLRSYKHWQAFGLFSRWSRSHWHFFFLGAAFLLLEVQNISKASVALGNTWEVNAIIISGVLVMILLANLLAYIFPRIPLGLVYLVLISICLVLYFVDLSRFAFLPYTTKALIIGSLTTLPMLFSGIVFIRSFAIVIRKDDALGANLIGALLGALLQSVTFVIGIKALLLMVAGFYILSMLTSQSLRLRKVRSCHLNRNNRL